MSLQPHSTLSMNAILEPSSFRDPSGFLFRDENGVLLRQVNQVYSREYELLKSSGLYEALINKRLLVQHEEVDPSNALTDKAAYLIRPEELPFISYPHEWSFGQLKDAALLTLDVTTEALKYGMMLKDASAYNVQYNGSSAVFIDTLSFREYRESEPWVAYSQFCRHFVAPLALMAKKSIDLNGLMLSSIDGIDLSLASRLLPWRTCLSGLLIHVHLNARFERAYSSTSDDKSQTRNTNGPNRRHVSKRGLLAILESLRNVVRGLRWNPRGTEWADYYSATSYDAEGFVQKQRIVQGFLEQIRPESVCDLGANTGVFTRIAEQTGARVWSLDIDPACVERLYNECKAEPNTRILPLRTDLSCPTPAYGWNLMERKSLAERVRSDAVLALALIHHLAISKNVPLVMIAEQFATLGDNLIIEFVPKADPQVQRLLRSREDVFDDYHEEQFLRAFERFFEVLDAQSVGNDGRRLFQMRKRDGSC